eukprot:Seg7030.2 transcript_id=Seg7030.2/GoldUCD/mRNA.D3Y31 product="hypothetical protein" protein_id=Seg7030.2/GoldUCD/D3Y31
MRRLSILDLRRRHRQYDVNLVRAEIRTLMDGPNSSRGYRAIWPQLQMQGISVPRNLVENLLREIDPNGVQQRRARRLQRRVYRNEGPNQVWHCDGYDKLKPYGFPVHGCIDGWSRKIIWLFVTRSNNLPSNIAAYYLESVARYDGCPVELVTDLGTENGLMAGIHSFFHNNPDKHRYVPSPRNQRIEGWWSFFRKSHSSWWMNLFKDLCETGVVDLTDPLSRECMWYCFANLLQSHLNQVMEHWNTHYIRRSRFETVHGRPDSLYVFPERRGGQPNLLTNVSEEERVYAWSHLIDNDGQNEYSDYIEYLMNALNLEEPRNWREGVDLLHALMRSANGMAA